MTETTTDGSDGDDLTLDEVLGDYIRKPVENNLDEGTIYEVGSKTEWGVDGGPKWTLIPDLDNNRFVTTSDCPYGSGKYFTLVVSGTTVTGFNFEGDFWTKR